ncbi:unnamed protein product [Strongylus vulgaris]|uniref:Uncharacterized protein n=1 Tax=Strongylus vulgaris TaxID=40348 RepID=A0A3P7ISW2_STRVU|nr:unnamed protein product [Strongylus vulgaris]
MLCKYAASHLSILAPYADASDDGLEEIKQRETYRRESEDDCGGEVPIKEQENTTKLARRPVFRLFR